MDRPALKLRWYQFRLRAWFVLTLLLALGYVPWQEFERTKRVERLTQARDMALADWRKVHLAEGPSGVQHRPRSHRR